MTAKGALPSHVRVVVIGAGFAGLGMAVNLRKHGIEDFLVLEKSGTVGGTWRDNTYPGCACDVPSRVYSFSFAQNSQWSYSYSRQPEILSYLERVAEELGVLPFVRFSTEVTAAAWDEGAQLWRLATTGGELTAQFVVVGGGVLAEPAMPAVPGLDSFAGAAFHSARWDHEVPLAGRRIAVIGTGASAIQFVPYLQREAAQVTVFQRTAPWVLPRRNVPVSERTKAVYRRIPGAQQAVRGMIYTQMELQLAAFVGKGWARSVGERRGRQHLEKQVADPALREVLRPRFALGCKRILFSNQWYPALCSDNVTVVPHGVREITPTSVVASDGTVHEADVIVLGTGFRPMEIPMARCLTGRGGRTLSEVWGDRPTAHRGTTVHGFPNLFLLLGPNTALGHNSVVLMMEAQMAYVIGALKALRDQGASSVEVRAAAQEAYNAGLQRELATTVWARGGCTAWYTNAEGHNFVIWPGSVGSFRRQMARFDADAYELVA
ncbi:MAG: putative flavoprotein CzcO associated with the cation diffusion facilitator CzcD [Frankiales bacterium]|nr:putative flavoprotein CzcO associated with the cation diffusion facilitator CzcD [Frankiales bacterium]